MSSQGQDDITSINRRLCKAFEKARERGLDSFTLEQFKEFSDYHGIEDDTLSSSY
jgi:hypothetical protein